MISDNYTEDRTTTPTIDAETATVSGTCPECSCVLIEQNMRVICTGCAVWCPLDTWEAYKSLTK